MKPQLVKTGRAIVRSTGLPMSFRVPPALEIGALDRRPAMKRKMRRAVIFGENAEASSKTLAKAMVTT